MALIEGLEAGEGEHASNWGDSAEQSRQARLQQLEALQSLEAMSTNLNAAAESPSNEPPNPLLGPQCSGANNAPLGSRQSRAEDFLTSLEGALLHGPRVVPPARAPYQHISSVTMQTDYSSSQKAGTKSIPFQLNGQSGKTHRGRQGKGSSNVGIMEKGEYEAPNLPSKPESRKEKQRRKRGQNQMATQKPKAETNRTRKSQFYGKGQEPRQAAPRGASKEQSLRSSAPQPKQKIDYFSPLSNTFNGSCQDYATPPRLGYGSPYSNFGSLQPIPMHALFATTPPDTCQTCNVNIAEIERTSSYQFPTMCPICHQPRSLLPLAPHQLQAPATTCVQEKGLSPASQQHALPGIPTVDPAVSSKPSQARDLMTPTERGVQPSQSYRPIYSTPEHTPSHQKPIDISERWLHDKYEEVMDHDSVHQGQQSESVGLKEDTNKRGLGEMQEAPLDGEDLGPKVARVPTEKKIKPETDLGLSEDSKPTDINVEGSIKLEAEDGEVVQS